MSVYNGVLWCIYVIIHLCIYAFYGYSATLGCQQQQWLWMLGLTSWMSHCFIISSTSYDRTMGVKVMQLIIRNYRENAGEKHLYTSVNSPVSFVFMELLFAHLCINPGKPSYPPSISSFATHTPSFSSSRGVLPPLPVRS